MTTPADSGELQFESVATPTTSQCTLCQASIAGEYYDVNGHAVCRACSEKVSHEAATPRDAGTLVRALLMGGAAAVLGALLYFAVIALSGFEIGLVAIAIGYMVGYGVKMGTRGRGGRRFQVMAVLLTYFAVGLAYSSLAIKELVDKPTATADATGTGATRNTTEGSALEKTDDGETRTGGGLAVALLQLLAFTFVFPVLVVAGSMPGGIISAAIIVFGMMQAWKMTAAPAVTVTGPYRLAASTTG